MIASFGRSALFALALLVPAAAQAQTPVWRVDPEASRVGFVASQSGSPVEGAFERFEADIRFDPENLEASRVEVVIDVASVDSGNGDRDDLIRSSDLFHAERFPTARFEADRFTRRDDGAFTAQGRLTMRDVTREIELPFTLEISEQDGRQTARAAGEVTVSRLAYGIGQGQWQDTSVVADEVTIEIDIRATRPAE